MNDDVFKGLNDCSDIRPLLTPDVFNKSIRRMLALCEYKLVDWTDVFSEEGGAVARRGATPGAQKRLAPAVRAGW